MGLRSAVALQSGADEAILAEVNDYEAGQMTTARQKMALRLADVFLATPATMPEQLQIDLVENFTSTEIVELLIRLIHWSSNKVMITLGLDLDEIRRQIY